MSQHLYEELNTDFTPWDAGLTADERGALIDYQDGYSALINQFHRDLLLFQERVYDWFSSEAIEEILIATEAIDSAINKGRLQASINVFRGLADFRLSFQGKTAEELISDSANGEPPGDPGFMSTSIWEHRARNIVGTPFPQHGAILELELAAGQRAAWLPLLGHETYAAQGELLLPRDTDIEIVSVRDEQGIVYVQGNVIRK